MSVERLHEVRDRSLVDAYEVHDVGQAVLQSRLEASGFHVVQHGDDARHVDGVYYGDGPDLAVYTVDDGFEVNNDGLGSQFIETSSGQFVPPQTALTLACYIEIKCKESPEWFGRCNRRHYNEYVNFNNEVDVPVFIWFAYVDSDEELIHRDAFVEVEDSGQLDGKVHDVTNEQIVFREDAINKLDAGTDLVSIEGTDVIEVRNGDIVVDGIPDVWGNDVIELADDHFRSYSHLLYRLDG